MTTPAESVTTLPATVTVRTVEDGDDILVTITAELTVRNPLLLLGAGRHRAPGGGGGPADLAPTVPFTQPIVGDFVDDFSTYADLTAYAAAYSAYDPGEWWYHDGVDAIIGPSFAMRLVSPSDGDGAVQYVPMYPSAVPTFGWVRARAYLSPPPSDLVNTDYTAALSVGWNDSANALAPVVTLNLDVNHLALVFTHESVLIFASAIPWLYSGALEVAVYFEVVDGHSRIVCYVGPVGGSRPLAFDNTSEATIAAPMEVFYAAPSRGFARGTEYGVASLPRFEVRPGLSLAAGCALFGVTLPA